MNDRAQGVVEALAWTITVLQKTGPVKARKQIEEALNTILEGVAEDFHARTRLCGR